MPYDFYALLQNSVSSSSSYPMPAITISLRSTDKYVPYNPGTTRLDWLAGVVYQDETMFRLILWANPNWSMEFDIPPGTVIRVPYPLNDVLSEVVTQIQNNLTK